MDIVFALLLISLLSLPGLALSCLCTLQQNRFLIAVSFSYSLFALTLLISKHLAVQQNHFCYLIAAYLAISFAVLIRTKHTAQQHFFNIRALTQPSVIGALLIGIATITYHILAAPYNEIPADIYTHI